MSVKTLERADVKVATIETPTETEQRTIDFYAVAFSKVPDKQGDRIDPRALDTWLAEFYKAGNALPLSYAHAAVLNGERDPFDIVGYAPADPEHVRVDDYGLRVTGFLETGSNDKARQVYALAKAGVLGGASCAFEVPLNGEKLQKDGSTLITEMYVREAGPCIQGANPDAYLISVKTREGTKWDGGAAMAACSSAADFGKIAFRRTGDSDPDTAAAWALPHHPTPDGAPGNADAGGVGAALGALSGARGGAPDLRDPAAARSHLEAHQAALAKTTATPLATGDYSVTYTVKHASGPSYIQSIHDLALKGGAKCSSDEVSAKADEESDEVRAKADNGNDGETRTPEDPLASEVRRWLAER